MYCAVWETAVGGAGIARGRGAELFYAAEVELHYAAEVEPNAAWSWVVRSGTAVGGADGEYMCYKGAGDE